jgi:AcrR family transcriptional regulator
MSTDDLWRRLRAAARRHVTYREDRDRMIVDAHRAGLSLQDIADAAGISKSGVYKIVRKERS